MLNMSQQVLCWPVFLCEDINQVRDKDVWVDCVSVVKMMDIRWPGNK